MRKWILSALLALCLVLALLPGSTRAAEEPPASGQWGENLTWRYDETTKTLTVSGTGTMGGRPAETDQYKEDAVKVVVENGVVVVGKSAFEGWSALTSVSLPASVIVIGDNAFNQCTQLAQVNIPEQVRYIGSYAFAETRITQAVIPDGVLEINSDAFSRCASLERVTVSENLIKIGDRAFQNCSSLACVDGLEHVKSIGEYAFGYCSALESIQLSRGVVLGERAFVSCGLTSLTIPSGSVVDSGYIFSSCTKLVTVEIEEGVTRLGEGLFSSCSSLKTIRIPESVTSIDNQEKLVGNCSQLEKIYCTARGQWNARGLSIYTKSEFDFPGDKLVKKQVETAAGQTAATTFTINWWYNPTTDILNLFVTSNIPGTTMSYKINSTDDLPWNQYVKDGTRLVVDGSCRVSVRDADVFPAGTVIYNISNMHVGAATGVPVEIHLAEEIYHVDAACDKPGFTAGYRCWTDDCDLPEQLQPKTILPTPHTIEDIPEVPPTPTTPGTAFGKRCAVCGQTLLEPMEIPATGSGPSPVETFTVTFDSQGGSAVDAQTVDKGGTAAKPADDPTKENCTFQGWFKESTCMNEWDFDTDTVNANLTLYAKWEEIAERFTVTFDSQGGSTVETQTVDKGGTAAKPANDPIKENCTFQGWFKESSCTNKWDFDADTVNADLTLYAKWTEKSGDDKPAIPQEFTITFDPNGGKLSSGTTTATTSGGKLAALPQAAWTDHTFQGWFTEKDGGTKVTTSTVFDKNATVYAHWTESSAPDQTTYTVTFNSQGGSAVPAQTVAKGGTASSPSAPTRSGYTFGGWFREAACTTAWNFASDTVTANVTLYAKWTANTTTPGTPSTPTTYTVTFDPNGGSGGTTLATGTDGRLSSLPANPSYAGYTFDGWYTAISGGTRVTTSTVFQTNTTVYAHWNRTSSTPSTASYQIYTPGNISGGSYSVSHNSAVEGTLVTIQLSPWGNYALNRLSAARTDTGGTLPLTGRSSNQFTFVMPASDVRLSISYTEKSSSSGYPYNQPPVSARPIKWYFSNGCIYHVTDGLVPFTSPLTRDMLVSVLYNMDASSSGDPTVWAASNGIVPDIYANWIWGRDKAITREQTAAILFCYAQHMGYNTAQRASLAEYSDSRQIRPGAWPAMSWSRAAGLITGTSSSTLSPQEFVSCAQANTILSRFVSRVAGTR